MSIDICQMCRDHLNLDNITDITIHILEEDSSPPYISKNYESMINPKSIFIIVGKEWLIHKILSNGIKQINKHIREFNPIGYITLEED